MCATTSTKTSMWKIDAVHPDPLWEDTVGRTGRKPAAMSMPAPTSEEVASHILSVSIPIEALFGNESESSSVLSSLGASNKNWKVGLADFCARRFRESTQRHHHHDSQERFSVRMEGLEEVLQASKRGKPTRNRHKRQTLSHPYILERSDVYCSSDNNDNHRLHMIVRVVLLRSVSAPSDCATDNHEKEVLVKDASVSILDRMFVATDPAFRTSLLQHLSCWMLQQGLRSKLESLEAIAFVGDGSILPRKSGTSDAPMASPPAVPIQAPEGSSMTTHSVEIPLAPLVVEHLPESLNGGIVQKTNSGVVLSGLLVPKGITLICGGGYHGKSTLLQAIAVGQYDKIPGDGRELCVSLPDAVMVRAEDGRYVNNCNISAFISNLPTPPGVTKPLDTEHFSTRDSSGSTSQAANVSEAIELGARALLVDEDISAANFMARDGRMRALVMDESITPLLYRVNGLYNTHGISTVVVVGGVGDWLDVPHQVILLDKYVVSDATAKAQSISRQFSYGHVEYAGRGVVHRLPWEKKGTPKPRRPQDSFSQRFDADVVVSLLDGGRGLVVYKEDDGDQEANTNTDMDTDDNDEEEGYIDASRLGQLLGKKQLLATGLCVAWILQTAPKHAQASLKDLLKLLDATMQDGGMNAVLKQLKEKNATTTKDGGSGSAFSKSMMQVLESVGYLERPRNFEIGQALTRMRGIRFDELPVEDDGSEEAARLEEEKRKKALADLWAKRRSRKATLSYG